MRNNSKNFFIVFAFIFSLLMQSCSNEEEYGIEVNDKEYSLNLKSPSGEKISSNILSLKSELAISIAERFEEDKDFTITEIKYLPLEKGYSAIISYVTEDGNDGNIVKTNNLLFNNPVGLMVKTKNAPNRLRNTAESGSGGTITISCRSLGNCDCKVTAYYKDGVTTYDCGDCDNCEMTVS